MTQNNVNSNLMLGVNVKIDDLSKYMAQSGVIVKPHIGRKRKKVQLPKEFYGKSKKAAQDKQDEFMSEYINNGSINIIPKKDESALASIDVSVRTKIKTLAIACDGSFMTSQVYLNEYLPYFNSKRIDYFEKRDEIVAKWDILIDKFKNSLEEYISDHSIPNGKKVFEKVCANLPSKEEFGGSFYMDLELSSFPVESNIDIFAPEVKDEVIKSITNSKVNLVGEILGTIMSESFDVFNKFLDYAKDHTVIHQQQMKQITNLKNNVIKKNILGHTWVKDIVERITQFEKGYENGDTDFDDLVEGAEEIIACIYGYSKDIEIDEYLDLSKMVPSEEQIALIYLNINPTSSRVSLPSNSNIA